MGTSRCGRATAFASSASPCRSSTGGRVNDCEREEGNPHPRPPLPRVLVFPVQEKGNGGEGEAERSCSPSPLRGGGWGVREVFRRSLRACYTAAVAFSAAVPLLFRCEPFP